MDCNEGTNGKAFCISIGSVKLEKLERKNINGVDNAPNKRLFVFCSINIWIIEIPQLKKINDSYKLLRGKYHSLTHRMNNVQVNKKLLIIIKVLIICTIKRFFKVDKLIQYKTIAIANKKEATTGNW